MMRKNDLVYILLSVHKTNKMKRIIQLTVLTLTVVLALNMEAIAQRGKQSDADKYFDESGSFTSNLWYGGGFQLGFSGGSFSSAFQLGISPMVGYKITDEFSVGPRVSLLYTYYRAETIDGVQSANLMDYGIGAFTRYKIFRSIFAHLEYGFDNEVVSLQYNSINGEFEKNRRLRNNALIGLGYNDGNGVWGYEISLLYNLLQEENIVDLPFDFRFGFTYNF